MISTKIEGVKKMISSKLVSAKNPEGVLRGKQGDYEKWIDLS